MTRTVSTLCGDRWFDPGLLSAAASTRWLLGLQVAVLVSGEPLPFWKVEGVDDAWHEWCHPMMKAERDREGGPQ